MRCGVLCTGWLVLVAAAVISTTARAQSAEDALDNSYRLDHDAFRDDLRQDLIFEDEAPPAVYRPFAPVLGIAGTLSPNYTNNALFTPDDPQSDFYFEPDINVRLDGWIGPKTSYRIYARTELNAFASVEDGDSAFALVGARLSQDLGPWRASLVYENRHSYNGIFEDQAFSSNDVIGTLARDYTFGRLTVMPFFFAGQRFANVPESTRFRFDAVLGLEYRLAERWALISTPFYEVNWFEEGANQGRRDEFYSVDIGIEYALSDRVSLTASVVSEHRISNFPGRDYDMLEVGPRLDFAF